MNEAILCCSPVKSLVQLYLPVMWKEKVSHRHNVRKKKNVFQSGSLWKHLAEKLEFVI